MAKQLTVPDFAAEYLHKQVDRVAFQVSTAITRRDVDSIHDLRVAIRRFAQGLSIFKPQFISRKSKKIRRMLKQTMRLAGNVRDCDIALKFVSKQRSPYAARLRQTLRAERRSAERALIETLKHWVARKTSRKWRAALEAAAWRDRTPPAHVLPVMAASFFASGARAARPKSSTEELHRFRLSAKKLRYTLEIFAPFYDQAAARWLQLLKKVQQMLGRINDCISIRRLLSRLGKHLKLEASLKQRERRRTAEFRRYWAHLSSDSVQVQDWIQLLEFPTAARRPARKPAGRSLSAHPKLALAARA